MGYFLFLYLVLISGLLMSNVFFMWLLLELVFFSVLMMFVKGISNFENLVSVVYYLMVQALGGLIFLVSCVLELYFYGNFFFINGSFSVVTYWMGVVGLFMKLSVFPFYFQVVAVVGKLEFYFCFVFLVLPKLLPFLYLYEMFMQYNFFFFLFFLVFFMMFVSGVRGVISNDFREMMSWSSVSHMSWMIMVISFNVVLFLFYFFLYCGVIYLAFFLSVGLGKKYYFGVLGLGLFGVSNFFLFGLVLIVSGITPSVVFLFKLFILAGFFYHSLLFLLSLMLGMVCVYLIYVRMLQMMVSSSYSYEFLYLKGGQTVGFISLVSILLGLFGVVYFFFI